MNSIPSARDASAPNRVDVVVVGGGAAGAVVAARASENPHCSVLFVEAGPDYEAASALPDDLVDGHRNSLVDHDWELDHLPVPDGRTVAFPRGRVMGGSTAVNTTIALRGVPADYDGWVDRGNDQWSWDRVLPAFNRLERDLDYGHLPITAMPGQSRYADGPRMSWCRPRPRSSRLPGRWVTRHVPTSTIQTPGVSAQWQ